MRIEATPDAIAVAKKTDWTGMPVAPSMPGLTARMYAMAGKVVRPARNLRFDRRFVRKTA